MIPAIQTRELCFSYGAKTVLRGVNLTVAQGETVVLTGDSGCGKTTLCDILCGVIPNAVHGKLSGAVLVAGENILGQPLAKTARTVGMVFQDADQQLICTTVEDELAFGPENLCMAPADIRSLVDATLNFFHLTHLRGENPARLSGGQKKLVTIAGVWTLSPPILILDEPMTGLDEAGRALVDEAIRALRQNGKTLLVVEHDPALFPQGARVLRMREGRL